jgi:hypothetical protein
MKSKLKKLTIAALTTLTLALPLRAQETPSTNSGMLSRQDAMLLTVTGTIEDIDYTNREVTLKGPLGKVETIVVDKRVKRLDEAKVGDKVTLNYYLGLDAELRKPTADEEAHPIQVLEGAGKAEKDESPAAGGLRRIKAVVTIEGLDRPTQTVTVKGPLGRYFVARVADPSRLGQARIGDTMVITFTQAAAVSLKKAK